MSRPLRSKALVYSGQAAPLVLSELEIPALQADQALVRVDACTLCGSDLHSLHGRREVPTPTVLGHEIVGTVIERGSHFPNRDLQNQRIEIGDQVTWAIVANCGKCFYCQRGLEQKCESACKYGHMSFQSGYALSGGLAEYCILASGTHVMKVPSQLPLEVISPASCATATVMAAMSDLPSASPAESTLTIIGAGMLGLTACAVAKQRGWKHVISVDPVASKRELAQEFGATVALSPDAWFERVHSTNKSYGSDAVLELSGASSMILPALDALRIGGHLVLVGAVFPVPAVSLLPEQIVRRQISLRGIHNYRPVHLREAVEFLATEGSSFPFGRLVSSWHGLAEVAALLEQGLLGNPIRVGVKPSFS